MIQENPTERKVDIQAIKVQKLFLNFLIKFEVAHNSESAEQSREEPIKYYQKLAAELKFNDKRTLYVDFEHLRAFDPTFELRECILTNYYRYEPYLVKAVASLMQDTDPVYANDKKDFYLAFYNLPSVDR
eukprot:TRINITY_DN11868_c0_g1_i9.p2 TRINITY_DN11868_c0_g1~~TRINITY_DN11868_c0_g1_i9.p2  ORF type:complete len:130 (-),score=26.03 TRINITY_DN11868_c0_g1_i9:511-900(-)